ncbi:hypothetical protein Btru_039723 [Bulinus truncatus]|nr:hypothetical protein Btru_039723 [Bulinus truncatus]
MSNIQPKSSNLCRTQELYKEENTSNPFKAYEDRGKHAKYSGTGIVTNVIRETLPNGNLRAKIWVSTTAHVVYDQSEAVKTNCRLNFDRDESPLIIIEGYDVFDVDLNRDFCCLICETAIKDIIVSLEKHLKEFQRLNEQVYKCFLKPLPDEILYVIISHPHGATKHISVGGFLGVQTEEPFNSILRYNTPTCSGSSGAPIIILGVVGWYSRTVHAGTMENTFNYSSVGTNFISKPPLTESTQNYSNSIENTDNVILNDNYTERSRIKQVEGSNNDCCKVGKTLDTTLAVATSLTEINRKRKTVSEAQLYDQVINSKQLYCRDSKQNHRNIRENTDIGKLTLQENETFTTQLAQESRVQSCKVEKTSDTTSAITTMLNETNRRQRKIHTAQNFFPEKSEADLQKHFNATPKIIRLLKCVDVVHGQGSPQTSCLSCTDKDILVELNANTSYIGKLHLYFSTSSRGKHTNYTGTGIVTTVLREKPIYGQIHAKVWVSTAAHVVYDQSEAVETKCRLYFDREESPLLIIQGCDVFDVDVNRDFCCLICETADEDIILSLEQKLNEFQQLNEQIYKCFLKPLPDEILYVIISHPHGATKHITVGSFLGVQAEETFNSVLQYNTPTCPGSSGAHIIILGVVGWYNRLVHVGALKNALNYSSVGTNLIFKPPLSESGQKHSKGRENRDIGIPNVKYTKSCRTQLASLLHCIKT